MQILSQLQMLGKCLDDMEQKSCKKSTDGSKIKNKSTKPKTVPQTTVTHTPSHPYSFTDLQSLRQDVDLQGQVQKRLQELTALNKTGTKVKSLRGDLLMSWYPIVSNGLTSTFFLVIQKRESKDSMLDYLISLFDDANGMRPRPATQSYYVGWNREKLRVTQRLRR